MRVNWQSRDFRYASREADQQADGNFAYGRTLTLPWRPLYDRNSALSRRSANDRSPPEAGI